MFIVIEGNDGVGKSSIIKELGTRVANVKCFFDPGISHSPEHKKWQMVREFIKQQDMDENTETLMFFAMRAELMKCINEAEKDGQVCIVDRFSPSTKIYQGILKGRQELIDKLEQSISFRKPDFTFILSAPFDVINERIEQRFKSENANMDKFKSSKDFRYKVWQEYEKYPKDHPECITIDANRSVIEVADDIENYIKLPNRDIKKIKIRETEIVE